MQALRLAPGEIDPDYAYAKKAPQPQVTNDAAAASPPAATDDIFGAEFKRPASSAVGDDIDLEVYYRGKNQYKRISPVKRQKVMKGYDNLRVTFLLDNLFVSAIGLSCVWALGTFKDASSYGIGALLGVLYAALLGRYVENLGAGAEGGGGAGGGASGGAARFAPVVLLILLYAKNKEYIAIIPELLGFFSFQIASLLQIFNDDAYGEEKDDASTLR